jgi:hypothetical protein
LLDKILRDTEELIYSENKYRCCRFGFRYEYEVILTTMSPQLEFLMNPHSEGTFNDDPLGADIDEDEEDEVDDTEYDDSDDAIKGGDGITKPGEHDVLLGRGGGTNNHCGNVRFRKLVNEHKMRYLACSKVDKPKVARDVVALWRKLEPPGRFLARKDETKRGPGSVKSLDNVWYEVGDKKAREKASQCLRERTPDVMPYIKHLRDQQNAITEHGVGLVQQQMQMQEQAKQLGVPFQPVFPTMTSSGGMPGFQQRRNSMPVSPPMGVPGRASGATNAQLNARRGSLPVSQHMGVMQGQQMPVGQQHQQQGFGRRPNPQQQMMQQQQQQQQMIMMAQHQQQMMNNGGHFVGNGGAFNVNNSDDDEEEYYDDMDDMEYQQSMMMMQQQVQMQQMQIQRMQEQQKRIHQQQRMQGRGANGSGVQPNRTQPMMPMSFDGVGVPMQQQQQTVGGSRRGVGRNRGGMMMDNGMNGMQNAPGPFPSGHVFPLDVQSKTNISSLVHRGGVMPHKDHITVAASMQQQQPASQRAAIAAESKNVMNPVRNNRQPSLKNAPTTQKLALNAVDNATPDTNPSGGTDMYSSLKPADPDADNELTLVAYRQQLEEYISNSSNQTSNHDTHDLDTNGIQLKFDDGEGDDNESDLEDDWEKEKEKAYQQLKERTGEKRRGVNRNVSGVSMMSTFTKGSNMGMSLASGMTGLSDMLTATSVDDDVRETKMNFARSISSNISLMSELTDLSQNIDTLSLNDNENEQTVDN